MNEANDRATDDDINSPENMERFDVLVAALKNHVCTDYVEGLPPSAVVTAFVSAAAQVAGMLFAQLDSQEGMHFADHVRYGEFMTDFFRDALEDCLQIAEGIRTQRHEGQA